MSRYPTGDPLLKGKDWDAVRAYWVGRRQPCHLCGKRVNYARGATGDDAFDCGHIVSRDEAKVMGWSRAQINALSNTRPECRQCSRSSGASYGMRKRYENDIRALESDEW